MSAHIFEKPDLYSKNNALQYHFAMKMLSNIPFSPSSRVLDIGCGDGMISNEIAQIVTEGCVIGTDISEAMIGHATKKYSEQDNIRFVQMDAARNFFRNQFDVVTSFNCLHWVSEQEKALSGIAHAAVSGAQIVLLLSHRKSQYHQVLETICTSEKWAVFFKDYKNPRSFFDIKYYKHLLINSGLEVISLIEEEMTYFYQTPNELKEFFNASSAQIKLIPDYLKESFLNDFSNAFLEQVNLNNFKEIPVSFRCLQIIARKPS